MAPEWARLHESIAETLAAQGDWRHAYQHLRVALDESLHDALTTVYNRRYLDRRLGDLLSGNRASPLAVALVDIDFFKQVNDTFGHLVGDQVLRRVATLLRDDLPDDSFCARYGGEEFVLVLPGVLAGTALGIVERARTRVAEHPWSAVRPGLSVTISAGLAHEPGGVRGQLSEADDLLYAAKHAGRNRVAYRERHNIRLIE